MDMEMLSYKVNKQLTEPEVLKTRGGAGAKSSSFLDN